MHISLARAVPATQLSDELTKEETNDTEVEGERRELFVDWKRSDKALALHQTLDMWISLQRMSLNHQGSIPWLRTDSAQGLLH